jgi:hypothetical protein
MQKAATILNRIQSDLVAPKNLRNTFGGYNYRSAESILEALKPHLKEHGATLTISDEIVEVGGRVYVKATVSFMVDGETITATAFARESETKKGMDESQITGACSSYARKYALNGLFCIDDTKDADATNDHGKDSHEPPASKTGPTVDQVLKSIEDAATLDILTALGARIKTTEHASNPKVKEAYETKKSALF